MPSSTRFWRWRKRVISAMTSPFASISRSTRCSRWFVKSTRNWRRLLAVTSQRQSPSRLITVWAVRWRSVHSMIFRSMNRWYRVHLIRLQTQTTVSVCGSLLHNNPVSLSLYHTLFCKHWQTWCARSDTYRIPVSHLYHYLPLKRVAGIVYKNAGNRADIHLCGDSFINIKVLFY